MEPGDNPPIGILLVTDKNDALVRYTTTGLDEQIFDFPNTSCNFRLNNN